MATETLKVWERIDRTHQGSWIVKVVSGKAIIQCPFCPDGRYVKGNEAGYYLAPNTRVLIIAVEDTVIEWQSAVSYGLGAGVTRRILDVMK